MTNKELAGKISTQINDLEKGMKEAIKPLSEKVGELEKRATILHDLDKIQDSRSLALMDRVAKLEQAKTTWGERGKQMGMGMVGAGIVLGATALIDWAFSGPNTVQSQQ
jgi:hypothetical protein